MFMIDLGVESFYSALGITPEAGPQEIRIAQSKTTGDLQRLQQRARTPEEKRSIEERLQQLNAIGDRLSNPQLRAEYNRENAHLTFFVVRPVAAPAFQEREVRLRWVHRLARDFLLDCGESVDPLTDLERSDFTADFTPNDILDDLLRFGRKH
jgi:curved DNA-binding protein CbpA